MLSFRFVFFSLSGVIPCHAVQYPKLIPLMQAANAEVHGPIDVYAGMGGTKDWPTAFPASCVLNSTWPECPLWCDKQSCDQCHPDDNGYHKLAQIVYAGLGF